jgi:hypothetical protein
MQDYNRMIANEIDETNQRYIQTTTQPTLFGGRRLREYVLPGMVNYAYPSTLAVSGDSDNEYLDDDSESDDEQFDFISMTGGRQNKVKKQGFAKFMRTTGRALKPVGKFLEPVAVAARDVAINKIQGAGYSGGKVKKQGFAKALRTYGRALKPVGKFLEPVAVAARDVAINKIQGAGYSGGKVHKQGFAKALRTYGRALKPVGKFLEPVAVAARDVAINKLRGMGRSGGRVGTSPSSYTPRTLESYEPVEFGGARPKSARAAIVKAVMAKNGCSMIEASKFIKKNNLY